MESIVFEAYCVGMQYNDDKRGQRLLEAAIRDKKNPDISLLECPHNEYNPLAVAVNINGYDGEVYQLGWLPNDLLEGEGSYYEWKETCMKDMTTAGIDANDIDFYISSIILDEDNDPIEIKYCRKDVVQWVAIDFKFSLSG